MARKICQYKVTTTGVNVIANTVPVIQLGIQALPGTTFKINNGNEIEVGQYGIYELDLTDIGGQISNLTFTNLITDADQEITSALVDIIYEN